MRCRICPPDIDWLKARRLAQRRNSSRRTVGVDARRRRGSLRAESPLGRGRAACGYEGIDIHEPCAAVELGVDCLDEPWLVTAGVGVLDGLADDDAGDELRCESGAPAEEDGVAAVPDVELLEGDGGLCTLGGLELGAGFKSGLTKLCEIYVSDVALPV